MAIGKVRYIGEPIGCIAAVDEATAHRACEPCGCRTSPSSRSLSIEDALDPTKPIIHDHARKPSNILRRVFQNYGDVDAGFAEADVISRTRTNTRARPTCPWSPLALAAPDPDGKLTLWPRRRTRTTCIGTSRTCSACASRTSGSSSRPWAPATAASATRLHGHRVRAPRPQARPPGRRSRWSARRCYYAHRGRHPTRLGSRWA